MLSSAETPPFLWLKTPQHSTGTPVKALEPPKPSVCPDFFVALASESIKNTVTSVSACTLTPLSTSQRGSVLLCPSA